MILNWIATLLLLAAAFGILLSRDWRWNLGILAVQYVGVFWLVHASWPIAAASVKLVTGWMACAALGMTMVNSSLQSPAESSWPQGRLFRSFAAGLAVLISLAMASRLAGWLGLSFPVAWGGLLLISMGILHLGISAQPLRVIIGLLTALAGFEIIYAAVENASLVTAALAVVNLGLALAGAYMLTAETSQEAK
ncbi:MAG: hypothetical protein JXB85_06935 [Anaerolineales bacterium]|nr:hypothetical protein [Anaerolineales bacterium]